MLGKYQLENISKENFDRSYVEILVKLMNEMNEAVVLDRNKLQIGKKQCAVVQNNFVNKTLNDARGAEHPAA